ncbi:hypothetical protein DFH06DRAFT_99818 [Mycena polygramma]|nr:hypothetical protein DFH06DRAFT_99818 [Mycena polygramma]
MAREFREIRRSIRRTRIPLELLPSRGRADEKWLDSLRHSLNEEERQLGLVPRQRTSLWLLPQCGDRIWHQCPECHPCVDRSVGITGHRGLQPCRFVSMLTALDLTWEMVLLEETADTVALLEALPDLHVFVQVPILDGGRIAEPQIYWSTHPTLKDTSQIPPGTFQIRFMWQVQTVWAWWEKHHYDVAKSIQEEYGFDSKTNAAAEALELPLFEACDLNSSPLPVEDEWCTGKVFELDPHIVSATSLTGG